MQEAVSVVRQQERHKIIFYEEFALNPEKYFEGLFDFIDVTCLRTFIG